MPNFYPSLSQLYSEIAVYHILAPVMFNLSINLASNLQKLSSVSGMLLLPITIADVIDKIAFLM